MPLHLECLDLLPGLLLQLNGASVVAHMLHGELGAVFDLECLSERVLEVVNGAEVRVFELLGEAKQRLRATIYVLCWPAEGHDEVEERGALGGEV